MQLAPPRGLGYLGALMCIAASRPLAARALGVLGALGLLAACHPSKPAAVSRGVVRFQPPTIEVGSCGEPDHDGAISASPQLEHADRDLDGDGRPEAVVVDRALCKASDGGGDNCYWNVFRLPETAGACARFAGVIAGSALEAARGYGDERMVDVRAYWQLGGGRMLLQDYRFNRGGYQLADVLLCRRMEDDRIECTEDDRLDR